jgi:rubrerythrin
MAHTVPTETELVAELNDLLKLDHDAVQAYTLAISSLDNESYKETLRQFRGDHERHIDELTQLIRARGGMPIQMPHVPTGAFKLAVQAVAAMGSDRTVLAAFKANERQVRDKYRRAAREVHTADVTTVLARAADDESRHYAWVLETLEDLGFNADSVAGQAERAFEVTHKGVADALEGAERQVLRGIESSRRALKRPGSRKGIVTALFTVGTGLVAAQIFRRTRK